MLKRMFGLVKEFFANEEDDFEKHVYLRYRKQEQKFDFLDIKGDWVPLDLLYVLNNQPTLLNLVKDAKFSFGSSVYKTKGSSWRGSVVGYYTTLQTKRGYCVESMYEPGSVQIYPESALEQLK